MMHTSRCKTSRCKTEDIILQPFFIIMNILNKQKIRSQSYIHEQNYKIYDRRVNSQLLIFEQSSQYYKSPITETNITELDPKVPPCGNKVALAPFCIQLYKDMQKKLHNHVLTILYTARMFWTNPKKMGSHSEQP